MDGTEKSGAFDDDWEARLRARPKRAYVGGTAAAAVVAEREEVDVDVATVFEAIIGGDVKALVEEAMAAPMTAHSAAVEKLKRRLLNGFAIAESFIMLL